jgi:hypothetical protein
MNTPDRHDTFYSEEYTQMLLARGEKTVPTSCGLYVKFEGIAWQVINGEEVTCPKCRKLIF